MKSKAGQKNKIIDILIIVFCVFALAFSVFYICNNISLDKSNVDTSFLGYNDAASEEVVDLSIMLNSFSDKNYTLLLSQDGTYTLNSKNNETASYNFSGAYEYKTGDDVFDVISEKDLYDVGLNSAKINLNNLFVVKANYGQHNIPSGIEYYNSKIHNIEDPSFYFLVYCKRSGEKIYASIHPLSNLSDIAFNESYF